MPQLFDRIQRLQLTLCSIVIVIAEHNFDCLRQPTGRPGLPDLAETASPNSRLQLVAEYVVFRLDI